MKTFHVALAPYLDQWGKKNASFYLSDSTEAVVAIMDFEGGRVDRLLCSSLVTFEESEQFQRKAHEYLENTPPITF